MMHLLPYVAGAMLLQQPISALPQAPSTDNSQSSAQSLKRAEGVREAFIFAWDGYYKYAFPNDQLNPVSNTYSNPRYVCF